MVNPDSDARPRAPRVDHGGRRPAARRVPPPAGARPRHPRGVRATSSDQILALLAEYDIGYIKWDHNRDLVEAGTPADGGRPGVHAQTLAVYRLIDEIRAAHPGLEIESCSSGGARVDLGILERTDRIWVSDSIDPLERQHMHALDRAAGPAGASWARTSPPAARTPPAAGTTCPSAPATAMFGHLGIEWDLTTATDGELGRARRVGRLLQGAPRPAARRRPGADRQRRDDAVSCTASSRPTGPGRLRDGRPGQPVPGSGRHACGSAAWTRTGPTGLRPELVAPGPGGLHPPHWWGAHHHGRVFSGATLEHLGVACPRVHPDQVVLYRADAEPS